MSTIIDFKVVVHVHHDNYHQRSISMETDPEGVPAEEVQQVLKSLYDNEQQQ